MATSSTSAPDGRAAGLFDGWNARLPSIGDLAFAAFWLALCSGALVAIPYDAAAAADSLQLLLLTNPAGAFLRGLHYWSAQLFLVFTALHLVEHLARRTEARVRLGVWLRLVLSTVVVVYLMVSGYVLKGDAEGQLARQVLAGLLERLPLLGGALHTLLVGPEDSLQLLYVQHAATATLLTLAFIVEHFRRAWPGAAAWLSALGSSAALSLAFVPVVHGPAEPVVKGPWYMLGLQELLHWLGSPGLAWIPLLGGLVLLAGLPLLSPQWSRRVKVALAVALTAYAGLTVIGYALRGANWEWRPPGARNAPTFADLRLYLPSAKVVEAEIPIVLGRREGCLPCHSDKRGFAPAHAAEAVGCAACHLGQPWSGNADQAHAGMVLVPGNLSTARATCGTTGCHGAIVERVDRSLMATGAGFVGVNRFVFGEAETPDGGGSLRELGPSAADRHLADLCASCHLAVEKNGPDPIDELSRGGGCTACHLNHHADKTLHPALDLNTSDEHCFGCHSRSGRISTSYAGWHETMEPAPPGGERDEWRVLQDGRVFARRPADVHHEAGLACVDCHTSREVMGDGRTHLHEEDAVEVACEDCHVDGPPNTLGWEEIDEESRRIVRLRTDDDPEGRRFLVAARSGLALVNVFLNEDGQPILEGKLDGKRHELKPPSPHCTGLGHQRVSCSACHSAWAPQCLRCHTQLGTDGLWHEIGGDFRAEPPSLGVRGDEPGRIEPFAPGMIITLGTDPADMARAFPPALIRQGRFERFFSPVEPHTTAKGSRSCRSCHSEPLALGLGRGTLRFDREREPRWVFEPEADIARDGLPADAWTGFLEPPRPRSATRTDARPFTPEEQRRILRVGACLGCHEPTGTKFERIYRGFEDALARMTPACVVPWPQSGRRAGFELMSDERPGGSE
ncbi:MAG: cytochrome b N-terminal domain-containing protein [Acidobacteriota bacterium]